MTQIDEPNLDKIDQEITDILLEHLVLANDNGQPYIQYTDVAVDKIITLIATQVAKARIDELNKLAVYRETNDKIDVDFVDWQMIENRLTTLQSTLGDKE